MSIGEEDAAEHVYHDDEVAPRIEHFICCDLPFEVFVRATVKCLFKNKLSLLNRLAADISANEMYGGGLVKALSAIKAKALIMPSETDRYFEVADNAVEVPHLLKAELRPIPSILGHVAGNPDGIPADTAFLAKGVGDLLLS